MTDEQTRVFSVIKHAASGGKGLTPYHARLLVEMLDSIVAENSGLNASKREEKNSNSAEKTALRELRQQLAEAKAESQERVRENEGRDNRIIGLERDLDSAASSATENEARLTAERDAYKTKIDELKIELGNSAAKLDETRNKTARAARGEPEPEAEPAEPVLSEEG